MIVHRVINVPPKNKTKPIIQFDVICAGIIYTIFVGINPTLTALEFEG